MQRGIAVITLRLILLLLALVFLALAAADIRAPRVNLMAVGLALWLLAVIAG
jgi:hypothetical protein